MLFILVADTLNRFLKAAQQDMHQHVRIATETIQFADDTVIISEVHPVTLKVIKHGLKAYARLSGLKINMCKSCFVPITIPSHLIGVVQKILGSPPSQLPITYLGLPLSIKKPNKIDYQPLLASIQNRLEGWKSNFLSYGGRITLVKAVLTAMPLHYMQALKIPKGIVRHIDRMRRSFLWKGKDTCRGINCLANWELVCARKENGDMGIIDLEIQNNALLTKWLWLIHHSPNGLWGSTLHRLYGITETSQLGTTATSSYFLKGLAGLLPFFFASQ